MFISEKGYKTYFVDIQFKGTLLDGLNLNKKMNENIYPFYLIPQQQYFRDFTYGIRASYNTGPLRMG